MRAVYGLVPQRTGAVKNIFVVGLDDFHRAQLETLPGAEQYAFRPLFTYAEIKQQESFPVARLLEQGTHMLRSFPGHVDAVIGYWDFPVSTTLPILRRSIGLPGPSLEAVLKCEHKYWSRVLQAQVAAEHVPAFCAVDPFAEDPLQDVPLGFPFWLKPVKSVLSHLGFRIADKADFEEAIGHVRAEIHRYAEPFNLILEHAELPPEIAAVDGYHCIAESIISAGSQCTQEGYAFSGEVEVYGTIDSLRCGPTRSSFSRYQYPSTLPEAVQDSMTDITRRVIQHIGYDTAPFNIEYFWDATQGRIWLLEINTRISKSHAPLFRMVDGVYHHQVMVELGLGRRPRFVREGGECALAAKFMVRAYTDARVKRAPTAAEIALVEKEVPCTQIQFAVREGMRLSELRDQDSYSFEVAAVFVGANSQAELEAKFHACMDRLPLSFETRMDD
ncbi:MAG: D-alanine--D-alanine ligase [Chromatiaceae bacterium]